MNTVKNLPAGLNALISTIEPVDGGVPSMTRWLCTLLQEYNISPKLAWYAPWRNYPNLSVPFYRTGRGYPRSIQLRGLEEYQSNGIGAWYPEFEFTHYLPGKEWKRLVFSNQLHFVVSGNTLAATPFFLLGVPFISWIATPWEADRKDRINTFSKQRRFLDYVINRPVLRRLEKKILKSPQGTVLALSHYTSKELEAISDRKVDDVMLMPVDERIFKRDLARTKPWKIGFSGRYCDPRKNIDLLLKAIKILVDTGKSPELHLFGDKDANQLKARIHDLGLNSYVTCQGHLDAKNLSLILQSLDIFVIPSHQEGLCISALEAMACGVPVVSTRCGGPEEFVIPSQTGMLVDYCPESLASAMSIICSEREQRGILSDGCCKWVKENASRESSRHVFQKHLYSLAMKNNIQDLM